MAKTAWKLRFSETALKSLKRIHPQQSKRIICFLQERIMGAANPRILGKPLKGGLEHFWRYRVGDYRILIEIQDQQLLIQVIEIDHRRDIYKP